MKDWKGGLTVANIYDATTRAEALRHRSHCDPRSAEIIGQLIHFLDRYESPDPAQTINLLSLQLGNAETELARVRGLLQRQWVPKRLRWWHTIADLPPLPYASGGTMQPWPDDQKVYDANGKDALSRNWKESCAARGFMVMAANYVHELLTTFPQSSSLVPSGAESADIGKLDTVDKHVHEWKLKGQVLEPDADGIYRLAVWDGSKIERRVPSGWSECSCGSYKVEKVNGEEVEVGRGAQQTKSSTGSESPLAVPSFVEMGKVNRVEETHCIGTFWKDDEIAIITDLSRRQELSPEAVLRQGLRLYRSWVRNL